MKDFLFLLGIAAVILSIIVGVGIVGASWCLCLALALLERIANK